MKQSGLALKGLLALTVFISVNACRSKNPPLTSPAPPPKDAIEHVAVERTQAGLVAPFDPKVDILFVIDNSESMFKHQANMSKAIIGFAEKFAKIKAIDFHIGYTVVHDKTRYGKTVPETCPGRSEPNWELPGTLKKLRSPDASWLPADRRYLTREDNYAKVLEYSLDPLKNPEILSMNLLPNTKEPNACGQGPEKEDSFTPVLDLLRNPVVSEGVNKGFRRPEAFLVVIFLTDANDSSGLSAVEMHNQLRELTGESAGSKKRFRAFAVTLKPNDHFGAKEYGFCQPDPDYAVQLEWMEDGQLKTGTSFRAYGPNGTVLAPGINRIAELAKLTEDKDSPKEGQILSICSDNYGPILAEYGTAIQRDVVRDMQIKFDKQFEVTKDAEKNLKVCIGDCKKDGSNELKYGEQWIYDLNARVLTIYGQKVQWESYPNEQVKILMIPVDDTAETSKPLK